MKLLTHLLSYSNLMLCKVTIMLLTVCRKRLRKLSWSHYSIYANSGTKKGIVS